MHPLRVADLASLASVSVGGMGKGKDGASRVPWRVRDPAWRLDFQNLVPEACGRAAGEGGAACGPCAGRTPGPRLVHISSPARGVDGLSSQAGRCKGGEVGGSPEESLEETLGGRATLVDTGDQMGHRGDSKESQGHTARESRQIWGPGGRLGNLKPPC